MCVLALGTFKNFAGVRRFLLKKQLFEQMKEEVLEEESQPPPIEEYCTEYDGNFNADGFLPEEDPYKIEPEVRALLPYVAAVDTYPLLFFFVNLIKRPSQCGCLPLNMPTINLKFTRLCIPTNKVYVTTCNAGAFYAVKTVRL